MVASTATMLVGQTTLKTKTKKVKMKTAIIILSDPKAGEDALGRMFNGLALAAEAVKAGDETEIVFTGAGTRWPTELSKPTHPAHTASAASTRLG